MDELVLIAISKRNLRHFGLIMGVMVATLFGIVLPWLWGAQHRTWPWWIAGAFAGLALIWPAALKWPYVVWMKIGAILGKINTGLILGLAYLIVFIPFGLILRMLGKDTLKKRWREDVETYRRIMPPRGGTHMERQF
ncbi:SxtJ family membrane protein [Ottowia testudinis]|uniref:SxtJ n=1 Tax=Ottowia testudinis TaxID=2816950 RepID=A0A975H3N0_9BURK|nr:SxtJ family membrane protein [Ottowia testudinis]QTD45450.1 hypothetical protein J1M35_00535 [Ottowia testudinis]